MPDVPIALKIDGLDLFYGANQVLQGIRLEINRGEVCALIGPNGAGKSSLVRAVCGRVTVKQGEIAINGAPAATMAARSSLGVAPQKAALYDHLTALENLICFGRQAKMSRIDARARANAVLSEIDLTDQAHVRASRLSGGMRQRLNIGCAIMHCPALLILDEPCASLDPGATEKINTLIEKLKSQQFGILLVTHCMNQTTSLANTVAILQQGVMAAHGALPDIIQERYGAGILLRVTTPNALENGQLGFQRCKDRQNTWRKSVLTEKEIPAELDALQRAGVALHDVAIRPADISDVMEDIYHQRSPSGAIE